MPDTEQTRLPRQYRPGQASLEMSWERTAQKSVHVAKAKSGTAVEDNEAWAIRRASPHPCTDQGSAMPRHSGLPAPGTSENWRPYVWQCQTDSPDTPRQEWDQLAPPV